MERLVDDWLAAHPEHPAIPHVEDGPADVDDDAARSAAAIDATDPGSILDTDRSTDSAKAAAAAGAAIEADDAAAQSAATAESTEEATSDEPARAG